jgi:hypothetical protein
MVNHGAYGKNAERLLLLRHKSSIWSVDGQKRYKITQKKWCPTQRPAVFDTIFHKKKKVNVLHTHLCGGRFDEQQLANIEQAIVKAAKTSIFTENDQKMSEVDLVIGDPFKSSPMFPVTPQVATGVWVDDANSTGSSLKAGIEMLKSQYNIEVTHALYLVDRFRDREKLVDEKQHLARLGTFFLLCLIKVGTVPSLTDQ